MKEIQGKLILVQVSEVASYRESTVLCNFLDSTIIIHLLIYSHCMLKIVQRLYSFHKMQHKFLKFKKISQSKSNIQSCRCKNFRGVRTAPPYLSLSDLTPRSAIG